MFVVVVVFNGEGLFLYLSFILFFFKRQILVGGGEMKWTLRQTGDGTKLLTGPDAPRRS